MWISVLDSLPPEGLYVDVWRRGYGRITDCLCYPRTATGRTGVPLASWTQRFGGYAGGATVSHWMLIPSPPEELES